MKTTILKTTGDLESATDGRFEWSTYNEKEILEISTGKNIYRLSYTEFGDGEVSKETKEAVKGFWVRVKAAQNDAISAKNAESDSGFDYDKHSADMASAMDDDFYSYN